MAFETLEQCGLKPDAARLHREAFSIINEFAARSVKPYRCPHCGHEVNGQNYHEKGDCEQ